LVAESLNFVSSKTAEVGDDIHMRLISPLVIDGVTVLDVGTRLSGVVTKSVAGRKKCKPGILEYNYNDFRFSDGTKLKLRVLPEADAFGWNKTTGQFELKSVYDGASQKRSDAADTFAGIMLMTFMPFLIPLAWAMSSEGGKCTTNGPPAFLRPGQKVYMYVGKTATITVQLQPQP